MERNLFHAMIEINRLVDSLHIPIQVKENASVIYRKILAKGLVQGRSISGLATAALYAACRISETPRTLKEISANSGLSSKYIFYCYRLLINELDLQIPTEDPIKCISKIASKIQVAFKTQRIAIEILREAKKQGILLGKHPMGLAAAALYIACLLTSLEKTQYQIAEAANITEVTLRNRYREMKEKIFTRFYIGNNTDLTRIYKKVV
jgi:transcription initiation factor TFIIB